MKFDMETIFEELASKFDKFGIRNELYENAKNSEVQSEEVRI